MEKINHVLFFFIIIALSWHVVTAKEKQFSFLGFNKPINVSEIKQNVNSDSYCFTEKFLPHVKVKACDATRGSILLKELPIVAATQSPYGGKPYTIPGKIEAEHYDLGGQGVAFNELTLENIGGAFRPDPVDIEPTKDEGEGYNIGWVLAGEWLEYTVNITTEGVYILQARVSAIVTDKTFHLELDGKDITGPITVPKTGGWQNWETVSIKTSSLTTGQKVLRVVFDVSEINLNHLIFTPIQTKSPFGQAAHTIPGRIEAEHYDLGGQDKAYSDISAGNEGGTFRTDDVDIEPTTDADGGYHISWIQTGEWLEYTVNVHSTDRYMLKARVAAMASGKSFHVELDGQDISGRIEIPNSADERVWQTVTVTTPTLTPGEKILRIVMDADDFYLNYLDFSPALQTSVEQPSDLINKVKNYPNPFRHNFLLEFNLQKSGSTNITIFDARGNRIKEVLDSPLPAGDHQILFDGTSLPPGIYVLKLMHKGELFSRKILKE